MKTYKPCPPGLSRQVDNALADHNNAYSLYHVNGDDNEAEVYWQTNDDRDMGIPTDAASDRWIVKAKGDHNALQRAAEHTGGTRFGIGQVVSVVVNGVPAIVEEEQ